MKTTILVVLLTAGFFLSGCVVERDFAGGAQNSPGQLRRLEGRWYKDGARDKATSIISTRDGMEARDELGGTSRLVADGPGFVRALDWGLRGEIRNDRINWENGAFWARGSAQDSNLSGQLRRLEGRWYKDGARDKATSIISTRDGMEARDELGGTSRLVADGPGFVRALDWGLRGEIRNDRINWENGAFWARSTNR